jgi:TonB family protein
MRRVRLGPVLILAAVAGLHLLFLRNALAQTSAPAQTPQPEVILTKLSPPVYPPLARQARISGEVRVEVSILKDGTLASAQLVSGHPILAPAALESAKQSTFECRTCVEPLTTYLMTYTFELKGDGDCCNATTRASDVSHSQGHIVVIASAQCLCDPSASLRRFRSAKCLYLWKCGKVWF